MLYWQQKAAVNWRARGVISKHMWAAQGISACSRSLLSPLHQIFGFRCLMVLSHGLTRIEADHNIFQIETLLRANCRCASC